MTVKSERNRKSLRQQDAGSDHAFAGSILQGSEDVLRGMLQSVIQEAVEVEFSRFLGARPYERSGTRVGWRNGARDRTLFTRLGKIELRIPRDRNGEFQPGLFARYQRSEQALVMTMAEMYLQGISTRKVSAVVEQLCGTTISASTVSACTKRLDQGLALWRERRLDATPYPYLVVDAHHEKIRREGQVLSTAALWVVGIRDDGHREHLGTWLGSSESEESWKEVFRDLTKRGLGGVVYIVSDEHEGLVSSLRRYFPDAAHQRCQVHYLRNALSKVKTPTLEQALLNGLRNVWAAPTRAEAEQRSQALVEEFRTLSPKVAEWMEETIGETLTFYILPENEARRRLKTTNTIEHHHAEVRRRTRVIRIFPNEESYLRLSTALAIEQSDRWAERRYIIMERPEYDTVKRFKESA
jgi:putative transposase